MRGHGDFFDNNEAATKSANCALFDMDAGHNYQIVIFHVNTIQLATSFSRLGLGMLLDVNLSQGAVIYELIGSKLYPYPICVGPKVNVFTATVAISGFPRLQFSKISPV